MKVGETFFIVIMMVTLSRASKLLKQPRIYNAFVTSDQKLQPSQAYPAIAPVVQGIQYPLPSYIAAPGIYQPFIPIPFNGAATTGRSFSYAVKQDYFSYNYYENDAATFGAKLPDIPDPNQPPALFAPIGLQPVPKVVLPYPGESRADTKKNPYDEQQDTVDDNDQTTRDDYADTNSPVAVPRKNQPHREQGSRQQLTRVYHKQRPQYQQSGNNDDDQSDDTGRDDATEQGTEVENDSTDGSNYLPVNSFVKNHSPKDPSIVDIPPEPLPIGKSKGKKKKPEEYPPPPGFLF